MIKSPHVHAVSGPLSAAVREELIALRDGAKMLARVVAALDMLLASDDVVIAARSCFLCPSFTSATPVCSLMYSCCASLSGFLL